MLPLFGSDDDYSRDIMSAARDILIASVGVFGGWLATFMKNRSDQRKHERLQAEGENAKQDKQASRETAKENRIILKYEKYQEHQEKRIEALEKRLDSQQKIVEDLVAENATCRAENHNFKLRMGYYEHIMRENGVKFTPFEELEESDDRLSPPTPPSP